MIKRQFQAVLLTAVFLLPMMASAMSFAKPLYLFSEVSGIVTRGGEPVSGAKIEQRYIWHWKDKTGQLVVTTDERGEFHFPEVSASSLSARLMPHEPVIQQSITIRVGDTDYLAWKYSKHNYTQNGEFPGKKLNLRCDLEDSEEYQLVDIKAKLGYQGICRLIDK